MPLELGVWRIDRELTRLPVGSLDLEERLEDFLDKDISIASPNWMVIGRQVYTDFGNYIDLLAIDRDGNLIVLELKKNKTPREVVAQILDYGSWVKELSADEIAGIFGAYLKKYQPERSGQSLDQAFCATFRAKGMPEELNESHQLVVVASRLDESTERIVRYLADEHNVPINAVFFRVFKDDEREYLSSIWFIDPTLQPPSTTGEDKEPWNGEFYVSFGHEDNGRRWEDAVEYGFISGGGGPWYSRTLNLLEIGKRVWVNIPGRGYVGVGKVISGPVKVENFKVRDTNGAELSIINAHLEGPNILVNRDNEDLAEYLVRVEWLSVLKLNEAVKEKGFFGNQNTVCKPVTKKWQHTVERLKRRFNLS